VLLQHVINVVRSIVTSDLKAAKYALDSSYLALQHNDKEIVRVLSLDIIIIANQHNQEFIRVSDENRFVVQCAPAGKIENKILGFYWVNPTNFIIITKHGVFFYAVREENFRVAGVEEYKPPNNLCLHSWPSRTLTPKSRSSRWL